MTASGWLDAPGDGNPLHNGPGELSEPGVPGPHVRFLGEVAPERVTWLWPGYLPLGKLVTLDGDPGVGKSTVTADLAARISTGAPMPDGAEPVKGGVLILSAEDGLADTIRPRLDAAGADPAQVMTITEMTSYGEDGDQYGRPVSLPGDLQAIGAVVAEHRVRLVVVDVLAAYLSGAVNSHRDQDVRRALHPLAIMAERTKCCVLVLRHLNKTAGTNAMYRGGGSIGIIGAARAAFLCGTDPTDDASRVLAPVKCNLAAEPPALAYQLVPDVVHGCARVQWRGESRRRAWELLGDAGEEERGDRDEAAEWLTGYLADANGGEARAADIIKAARADGIAERTLKRARARAGITSHRVGFGQGTVWRLALGPHSGHWGHSSVLGPNGPNDAGSGSP
jgi:hypothetical protein